MVHSQWTCDTSGQHTTEIHDRLIEEKNTLILTKMSSNNKETLEQGIQFPYLGCSISYQFSNYVEFKLAKFTINRY